MSQEHSIIKFTLKTPDTSNRKIGILEGLQGSFEDFVNFYDPAHKLIVFKNRKFDCSFEGDWNGFSFHFGDFVRFVGLVSKHVKFIKTGIGCTGNIGNNCVLELGVSNNFSVINGNYVKFGSSSILSAGDFNFITAETESNPGLPVISSDLTIGNNNKVFLKHAVGKISMYCDNEIFNETGKKLESVMVVSGFGNSSVDGGLSEMIDGTYGVASEASDKDGMDTKTIADFIEKNIGFPGTKVTISPAGFGLGGLDHSHSDGFEDFVDHEDPYFSEAEINRVKKHLRKKIVGQDDVLDKMDDFLDGINIKTKKGPAGVFFQIGKTGTGKNYLWETFAEAADVPLKLIDASTFHESEGSSLLGTTQGYVGSSEPSILETFYAESLEYGGRCVVIIDELDKITVGKSGNKRDAVVAFVQTLMNVLENDTLLLKNSGEEIDISKFIFVMNTNLFVDEFNATKEKAIKIGFLTDDGVTDGDEKNDGKMDVTVIKSKLKEFFPLSVYNRLSSNVFLFNEMSSEVVDSVIKKELKDLVSKIKEYYGKDVKLPTFAKVRTQILENYDKDMGMRGIKNYIHDHLKAEFIKIAKGQGELCK